MRGCAAVTTSHKSQSLNVTHVYVSLSGLGRGLGSFVEPGWQKCRISVGLQSPTAGRKGSGQQFHGSGLEGTHDHILFANDHTQTQERNTVLLCVWKERRTWTLINSNDDDPNTHTQHKTGERVSQRLGQSRCSINIYQISKMWHLMWGNQYHCLQS